MFDTVRLRQVPIVGMGQPWVGPAGTPFYTPPPAGVYTTPGGAPLMSEELTSPEESHIAREFHCYRSPDGKQFISVPFAQRDAYLAAGWTATDYANCQAPPLYAQPVGGRGFVMGQEKGGGGGGGGTPAPSGGTPGAQGTPTPASPPAAVSPSDQGFLSPTFPLVPPGTTCAWEKDASGNNVWVCRQASGLVVPSVPLTGPVTYPVRQFFPFY